MSTEFTQGPNVAHPERASAVGSRNSINRNARDEYKESKLVVDEEVDKILNHLNSKLPPEVLSKLHISSTVKELLHSYFNQGMQNMLSRYLTTVEDEMAKKFRDFIDNTEQEGLNKYTPAGIPKLLDEVGGKDKFNTAEVEKSVVNIYGHLQGHVQRGQFELEQDTNDILRQRADVGAFIRGDNVHSIVKCAFINSLDRPKNVTDISLSVNVLDAELVSPIYHHLTSADSIIGQLVSDVVMRHIDDEVKKIDVSLLDEGKESLTNNEAFFERIKMMGNLADPEVTVDNLPPELQNSNARAMFQMGKKLVKIVKGVPSDISKLYSDPLAVKRNITQLLSEDAVRSRGFNTAVNTITAILDTSRMGYQYIENNKNARHLIIREYQDTENLPDESYEINMSYLDVDQLRELRIAYLQQFEDFECQFQKIWDVCYQMYLDAKQGLKFIDYDDVKAEFLERKQKGVFSSLLHFIGINGDSEDEDAEGIDRVWDEITFITPTETDVEKSNNTFQAKEKTIISLINITEDKLRTIFKGSYPIERICIEDRMFDLKRLFHAFTKGYNPFHCQSGLNIQMNIRTIKRKKTTMKSMSNVLNEFLFGISTQFQDQAFADFKRRRSTDTTVFYEKFSAAELESE